MRISNHKPGVNKSLSKIFTNSTFRNLVREGKSALLKSGYRHLEVKSNATHGEVLKWLYKELSGKYKSEYFYKNTLLNELLLKRHNLNTTTILDEFRIAGSIADFVLLNGETHIYEIKTELDTLDKLEKQIADYLQFSTKVSVVADSKHIDKLLLSYSASSIGIVEFESTGKLNCLKEAKSHNEALKTDTIFKCLRKSEYTEIIEAFYGYTPKVPNTRFFKECLEMARHIPVTEFQNLSFIKLKGRIPKNTDGLLNSFTPYELKHICYFLDLNNTEYARLYRFLNRTV